jgi:hypothetical protein
MAFPVSPTDGQLYTTNFGSRYKYYLADDKWIKIGLTPADQGATGYQGITGASGVNAPQGVTGLSGTTGAQGVTGLIGSTGYQGITGLKGITGSQGIDGVTGVPGTTGLANFIQTSSFSPSVSVPELMWNFVDESFYGFVTGVNKWVQISSGGLKGSQGDTGSQGVTGLIGSAGSQGATGIVGCDAGATGIVNLSFNNGINPIAPFTGLVAEFELPFNFNIYGWDARSSGGSTGYLKTVVFNQTFSNYTVKTGDTSMSGLTGPWLNGQLKNLSSTSTWPGPTGAIGDIVSVWAGYVTGINNLSIALKYNKW